MSTTTMCAFCESLPERSSGQAAKTVRCPLCKTDLGVTASGVKFRVGADAPAASHRGRNLAVAGGFGACVLLSAMVVTAALWNRPASSAAVAPTRTPQLVPSTPPPVEEAPAAPEPSAKPDRPALPPGAAKPAPHSAKPAALLPDDPPAVAAAPPIVIKNVLAPEPAPEVERRAELVRAAEVALHPMAQQPLDKDVARKLIADMAHKARAADKEMPDGFVRLLMKERADLAGLPFLLGNKCRSDREAAQLLAAAAEGLREFMGEDATHRKDQRAFNVGRFWESWTMYGPRRQAGLVKTEQNALIAHGIPALAQVLGPTETPVRMALVEELDRIDHVLASQALVKFAIYDLDRQVRERAISALQSRERTTCLPLLMEGLRHPWAVAADNAAQALVKLQWQEAKPLLVDFLEAPDPGAPFIVDQEGSKRIAVREMVRINHHRNCQLCHPPANRAPADSSDAVVGLTPSQAEKLPASSGRGYAASRKQIHLAIRADITYLRQDFSVMLPVADAAPWPALQRFDFLVRTRLLEEAEATALARRPAVSPQHQAALWALRKLTGADFGLRAAAWRESFATASPPSPMPATAPRAGTILP